MNKKLANSILSIVSLLYFPAIVGTNFNILAIIAATVLLVVFFMINLKFSKSGKS